MGKRGPQPKKKQVLPVTAGRPSVLTGEAEVDAVLRALYDATDTFGWSCQETALMAVQFAHVYVRCERMRARYDAALEGAAKMDKAQALMAQRLQALWMDLFRETRQLGREFGLTPDAIAKLPKPPKPAAAIEVPAQDGKKRLALHERGL